MAVYFRCYFKITAKETSLPAAVFSFIFNYFLVSHLFKFSRPLGKRAKGDPNLRPNPRKTNLSKTRTFTALDSTALLERNSCASESKRAIYDRFNSRHVASTNVINNPSYHPSFEEIDSQTQAGADLIHDYPHSLVCSRGGGKLEEEEDYGGRFIDDFTPLRTNRNKWKRKMGSSPSLLCITISKRKSVSCPAFLILLL